MAEAISEADKLVICACGALTPLGLSAAQTAATVRAGISAAAASDLVDADGERVVLGALPWDLLPTVEMPPATPLREQELIRLAHGAVADVLHEALAADLPAVPTWCAWPSRDAGLPLSVARCTDLLTASLGGRIAVHGAMRGGTAGVQALSAASAHLRAHGGLALVVAADSNVHPFILATLLREQRVKTTRQREGLIPGHGAAALLLADAATATRLVLPHHATLGGFGRALDPHAEPRGEGLSRALRQALGDGGLPVRAWWTTLSGERAQAQEHSTAQIRSADRLARDLAVHHLAMNLGDTGVAAALLAIVCALSSAVRPVLISATADTPERAALLLI